MALKDKLTKQNVTIGVFIFLIICGCLFMGGNDSAVCSKCNRVQCQCHTRHSKKKVRFNVSQSDGEEEVCQWCKADATLVKPSLDSQLLSSPFLEGVEGVEGDYKIQEKSKNGVKVSNDCYDRFKSSVEYKSFRMKPRAPQKEIITSSISGISPHSPNVVTLSSGELATKI